MKKIAVIMAGGLGVRLWPRSREQHPKQFTHILGEGTMIQNSVARLQPLFNPEDIYIVTTPALEKVVYEQLPLIPKENVLLEPFGRNTAPCVALAATLLEDKFGKDTLMVVLPSDHLVTNVIEYQQALETACKAAEIPGNIVTLGVTPTRPESSFGYIQVKDEETNPDFLEQGIRTVTTFAEKPDLATARRFLKAGDFLWNTGIYFWTIPTFWAAFEQYLPEHAPLFHLLQKHLHKETYNEILENIYRQLRSISLDYGILEKARNVLVIEGQFGWSDVGSWDEVYLLSRKDAQNNVIEGNAIAIDTNNCYVRSHEKLLTLIGVDDLIVVDSDVALFICKRESSQNVKEVINFMRRKHITHFL